MLSAYSHVRLIPSVARMFDTLRVRVTTELKYCRETVHYDFHNEQHSQTFGYELAGSAQ